MIPSPPPTAAEASLPHYGHRPHRGEGPRRRGRHPHRRGVPIYGRYGFGQVITATEWTIDVSRSGLDPRWSG